MSGAELSLALLGLVRDINKTVSRFQKSSQAPKEAETLFSRLVVLQKCLSEFNELHKRQSGGQSGGDASALDELTRHMQALEDPIWEIHDGFASIGKLKRGWHKFKYFRNPDKIRDHEQALSGHVESMQAIPSTFTAYENSLAIPLYSLT